jgi:hypothetical protein
MKARMEMENHDAFEQLRAELAAVEPSPAFAAGVRARIESPGRVSFRWQPALAFAAVAMLVVAGGAYLLPQRSVVTPIADIAVATVTVPTQPGTVPVPTVAAPRRVPVVARGVAPRVTAEATPGPYLEVITNQPEMLRRVWAGIAGGVARVGLPTAEFAELTVAPVLVDAIVVPRIGPAAGGGLVPGARRVVVDESARGDQR